MKACGLAGFILVPIIFFTAMLIEDVVGMARYAPTSTERHEGLGCLVENGALCCRVFDHDVVTVVTTLTSTQDRASENERKEIRARKYDTVRAEADV